MHASYPARPYADSTARIRLKMPVRLFFLTDSSSRTARTAILQPYTAAEVKRARRTEKRSGRNLLRAPIGKDTRATEKLQEAPQKVALYNLSSRFYTPYPSYSSYP